MSPASGLLLLLFGLSFGALALVPRHLEIPRLPRWLRVLAPSYRFFESLDTDVDLEFRPVDGRSEAAWQRAIPARAARKNSLLWAPETTLRLLAYQLVDELLSELAELGPLRLDEVQKLERFVRLRRLVQLYHPEVAALSGSLQLRIIQFTSATNSAGVRTEVVLLESTELVGEA